MTHKEFEAVCKAAYDRRMALLSKKAQEYGADQDRLNHFKIAAALAQESPANALLGMANKHVVSIYDMVRYEPGTFTTAQWLEKLDDVRNYLDLLEGVLTDQGDITSKRKG